MSAVPITSANSRLEALVDKVDQLAVLPHVVFKVLEITGDTDSPASDMEKAIIVDPGFSSKVLSLANSAMYALPKKVTSIKEAVMFLGFRTVRTMAMTVGAFDLFVGKTDAESLRRREWWRHSVDTAVCARWLAMETRKVSADEAYTCGLLHYIGKTLLDRFGEGGWDTVAQRVAAGEREETVEREVFGCDHVEVSIGSARRWGFPDELIQGLDYLEQSRAGYGATERRAITALASAFAQKVTLGSKGSEEQATAGPSWAISALGLETAKFDQLAAHAPEVLAEARLNLT